MVNDISETKCKYMNRPIYITPICIIDEIQFIGIIVVNEYNGINDVHV